MVGVLANHVPTIGVLKPGVVTVTDMEGKVFKLFVSSGTLSVNIDGTCQVLAEEVVKVEDIDQNVSLIALRLDKSSQCFFLHFLFHILLIVSSPFLSLCLCSLSVSSLRHISPHLNYISMRFFFAFSCTSFRVLSA
ncbi:ATP synthase, delta/epsilon subunit, beta-sandwich domain protein [Ancylostoma duodenale]|uniref:ATP synthase, delta/epsilon subunit, beta-sandwich domain protein n=1 Tax=Ancylostoma duodenale TaxID=51022 RepID=A0A0C2FQC8_9BILA|nr:ATP synthase, delta/epsilon subunit, beta-sandwich domain protein [Ancylostoma duodenale]